ncbi:MAG: four helix bundle protein [Chitinophagales bacterium]|nr:four helix bundle protein [Chitinophagales bacterium]
MSKIERIEDLIIWQKARELNKMIYDITKEERFSKDYALKDQIRRASISVASNIAEGFERMGDGEFKYFLSVVKGSLGELRAQLYLALDTEYISKEVFDRLNNFSVELSRMIGSFISYLHNSNKPKTRDSQIRDSRLKQ